VASEFGCDLSYGRRISGYTGHSAAFLFGLFAELRNAMGVGGVFLWDAQWTDVQQRLLDFITFNLQENGPA
jgi:hypothetical protein